MNGELAQVIALVSHGNQFLSGAWKAPPELFPQNSTFRYVSDLSFKRKSTKLAIFRREETVATDTSAWFESLKRAGTKRLGLAFCNYARRVSQIISPTFGQSGGGETLFFSRSKSVPQHVAAAFAGGGDWVIEAESDNRTELWRPLWSVQERENRSEKIWSVEYSATVGPPDPIALPGLQEAVSDLQNALTAGETFAEEHDLVYWADLFEEALELLHNPAPAIPYHADLVPSSFVAQNRRVLASACKAWVFGGMGSWNDTGFETDISFELYRALMHVFAAATNQMTGDSSAPVAATASPGFISAGHQLARVRDSSYWIRRLRTDRRAEAVEALVKSGAAGIAAVIGSMERSYASVENLLKKALAKVDRDALVLQLVDHNNTFVRTQALVLLAERAADSPSLTRVFRNALQDPDTTVRIIAVQTLGKCGSYAKDIVPELVALLKSDSSDSVCIETMRALVNISSAGAAAVREAQEDEDARMRELYADAFQGSARGTARAKKSDIESAKADLGKTAELEPVRHGSATTPQSEKKDEPSDFLLRRAAAAQGTSDRLIIPGERIGPLRLAGKIDEFVKLLGPGTRLNPERQGDPALETWDAIGLWVQFDEATGNIMSISVDSGPKLWAQHKTREGITLGTKEAEVVALLGAPERTVTGGPSKSLYYDRLGIRLTVAYIGPFAGKVGSLRVVWPAVPCGDTLIVAGKRISCIEVGMPIDKVLSALRGGYHRGESRPGVHIYYWPHLGLSVVERSGRVTSVRAARHGSSDAANIRYATSEDLGLSSQGAEIKKVYGEDAEKGPEGGWLFWTYRFQGISFALDGNSQVTLVDVFPPEK
jgi:hypothetical protein